MTKSAIASLALGAFALAALACSETERSHVFAGRLYESDRGCLDTVTSIDVVDGPLPSTPCAPTCFVSGPQPDGGSTLVYVSTMCAPFPPAYDGTGSDARCAPALAAYGSNTTCLDDGGIANPPDASHD